MDVYGGFNYINHIYILYISRRNGVYKPTLYSFYQPPTVDAEALDSRARLRFESDSFWVNQQVSKKKYITLW